jgi:hypothetical protein
MANRSSGTDPLRRRWFRRKGFAVPFAAAYCRRAMELLDSPLDGAQDGKQMELLLD